MTLIHGYLTHWVLAADTCGAAGQKAGWVVDEAISVHDRGHVDDSGGRGCNQAALKQPCQHVGAQVIDLPKAGPRRITNITCFIACMISQEIKMLARARLGQQHQHQHLGKEGYAVLRNAF